MSDFIPLFLIAAIFFSWIGLFKLRAYMVRKKSRDKILAMVEDRRADGIVACLYLLHLGVPDRRKVSVIPKTLLSVFTPFYMHPFNACVFCSWMIDDAHETKATFELVDGKLVCSSYDSGYYNDDYKSRRVHSRWLVEKVINNKEYLDRLTDALDKISQIQSESFGLDRQSDIDREFKMLEKKYEEKQCKVL